MLPYQNVEGRRFGGLLAVVKQAAGSDYGQHPLEVLPPDEYDGPLDYKRFRDCVERYYRSLVGADGSLIAFTHEQTVGITHRWPNRARLLRSPGGAPRRSAPGPLAPRARRPHPPGIAQISGAALRRDRPPTRRTDRSPWWRAASTPRSPPLSLPPDARLRGGAAQALRGSRSPRSLRRTPDTGIPRLP